MSKEKARAHFLGQHGQRKLNCAQSVIQAFRDAFDVPAQEVDVFAAFGGGKAPEGRCGAYQAAHHLVSEKNPLKATELEQEFLAAAGSLNCKQIRSTRKLSCLGCVEKAAELLENIQYHDKKGTLP